ncbi:GNAT family N-acetyltransferase [Streptomyces hainanensis]|uniref:GNAT family N-acetyltransferase n=1 Tax=Streptomyces hainanensis TaxID=402648 RepID=A0A4R4SM22_9ACTN|nr:GNAT family N-acetyltransferase [Streptomyces hainanensis]TDC62633.1 GNAT family N-acetyltransferase [Streptomyces hainanensis]
MSDSLSLQQYTSSAEVTPALHRDLSLCWIEVSNAGGAAGFPFLPIDESHTAPALRAITDTLSPTTSRLLTARLDDRLVGWLNVRRDPFALISHWGTLHHVQTLPTCQGRGIGTTLMNEARRVARDDMGLEQLHLAARGGAGLEEFYGRLGWKEIGRWPDALRLAPGDDRDEVLMLLKPL